MTFMQELTENACNRGSSEKNKDESNDIVTASLLLRIRKMINKIFPYIRLTSTNLPREPTKQN